MDEKEAKNTSADELLKALSCTKDGLSSAEAQKRLENYGLNEIVEKKLSPLVKDVRFKR
ncbi:MAG: hypothetical protein KGJ09_02610 [Candidatus Omnitrophica bacterium]|nr:hypothetical protein [Candidatus Omnitrophota bacterium]MDE2008951.1 hypothetical protein [Candidatus Omnitrophota bacterium]MDE2213486.1 hypothetical protein [Candidatus Omnitrophota bacterium]MDE2230613.1 hypothetical protein [Candidatus Omnitrophota bacterium]